MPCSGMAAFHQKATTSSWVTTSTVPRHIRDHTMTFFTPCVTKCGTKCVTKMANTLSGAWNIYEVESKAWRQSSSCSLTRPQTCTDVRTFFKDLVESSFCHWV